MCIALHIRNLYSRLFPFSNFLISRPSNIKLDFRMIFLDSFRYSCFACWCNWSEYEVAFAWAGVEILCLTLEPVLQLTDMRTP